MPDETELDEGGSPNELDEDELELGLDELELELDELDEDEEPFTVGSLR